MKKIILGLSLLALQVLAIECTEKEYAPYFNSDKEQRYMYSYTHSSDDSDVVIDKKSIVYDEKNKKVISWVIHQNIAHKNEGTVNVRQEFNLQNNSVRVLESVSYDCEGNVLHSRYKASDWHSISPNSGYEYMLKSIKKYLKI